MCAKSIVPAACRDWQLRDKRLFERKLPQCSPHMRQHVHTLPLIAIEPLRTLRMYREHATKSSNRYVMQSHRERCDFAWNVFVYVSWLHAVWACESAQPAGAIMLNAFRSCLPRNSRSNVLHLGQTSSAVGLTGKRRGMECSRCNYVLGVRRKVRGENISRIVQTSSCSQHIMHERFMYIRCDI